MQTLKRILGGVRRTSEKYGMISDGDRIAVGISGGKDSLTLLAALAEMRRFYPHRYEVIAVTVDMGFDPPADFSRIREFCDGLGVEYHIVPTQIFDIVFRERKEENPCSLCARMRRGALYDAVKKLGCNKLALGHHLDDAVNTFLMNLFFEGRIGCFSPVTVLDNGITLIRPMLDVKESDVLYFVSGTPLPILKSPCPEDGHTERAEIGKLVKELERKHKGLRHRILLAMERGEVDGFFPDNMNTDCRR